MAMSLVSRITAGGLVGQAIGDALGAPVEGFGRDICARYIEEFLEDRAAGEAWTFDGQYTDDTQLCRELAVSFAANAGRWNPFDFAARISNLFAEGRVRRPGRATSRAADRLRAGVPWHLAGEPQARGNGAAMRAAPVGWLLMPHSAELTQIAAAQAAITHQDADAQAGAVAIAQAVALLIARPDQGTEEFIAAVAAATEALSPTLARDIRNLKYILGLSAEHAHAVISGVVDAGEWAGTISPHVTPSVLWALYAFLQGRPDFLAVVRIAVSGGGDSDTTAAMAGALIGVELGIDALPQDLVSAVHDGGRWGAGELIDLATRLAKYRSC